MLKRSPFSTLIKGISSLSMRSPIPIWHVSASPVIAPKYNLPTVPTTSHVSHRQIARANFFAGYRPLAPCDVSKPESDPAPSNFTQKQVDFNPEGSDEYVLSLENGVLRAQALSPSGKVTESLPVRISSQVWEQLCDTLISTTPISLTSVKRKRKLKMNKHKYKKRMRKQRALRKRLGK
ncbi:mRNA processing protein Cox24 [Schizosaccharomyces cryophilus OY26]|uniref:Small ribosomal subunit protein mS38 n=1 Tax=Schizosaccharomyces cryophilus (strain OY26 / ATCC MYA-4695 / CBS 11777 / NBRC 106824 / NRRL Y48691) TaxID=653667 RepID=S9X9G2_SCHCR|nr:mRNA processing protein Cox24 [Schizosaccharomyces cryophilus OY26]EPY50351.1 mRNA processing protein Cox24 [Schizosaccharomyces cryophilus OY26]